MLYRLFSFTYVILFLPLYTCILCFNVVYTDKYSSIVIETSVDQIYVSWTMKQSLCWNTSSESHRTVKASSILCWKEDLTWLSSSAGLILAKRRKSMMVSCLAISSGSKSNKLRTDDKLEGNCKRNKHMLVRLYAPPNVSPNKVECTS